MAYASGYFKTSYGAELALVETRLQWAALAALGLGLGLFPLLASPFALDLANQVLLAVIGAVALMLLTGYAGQISLGHAGLLAAGAFTTGILAEEAGAPFWLTVPASGAVGAVLGLVFGLPSLRLKGLYLAVSTLALHFIVAFLGSEYETRHGFSTGILLDSPRLGPVVLDDARLWYGLLLAVAAAVFLFSRNLLRTRTGRAWIALRDRDVVAAALGIPVAAAKLSAFVVSSVLTALAGCLFAYYRGFVSIEAFSLFTTIEYVAMLIIGGLGSLLGAVLGAVFVVTFPYLIDLAVDLLPVPARLSTYVFAVKYAAFGLIMLLFLLLEPEGLLGIWRRVRDYFVLWPFRYRPLAGRS
ncbi:MAG: branched-chain amino acid ABC transporter permease [Candidatus Tectimicrobiota bacterium]|nr:MAG: branched-chain amino acid ABC transporter permease [Candidatus Tectomicrobia bacterium]